jgi:ribosomal protein S18 acetylase RimI-like enzyme
MTAPGITIDVLAAECFAGSLPDLAALLNACVHAGASIGFVLPHTLADSRAFWETDVRPAVEAGKRLVLVAREGERVVGSVQLDRDTPENQPHRAEVRKLLVHPAWRRRGIARRLMVELEARARVLGRSLITLDTRTGDAAEPLYASLGYEIAGVIPGFARDPFDPGKLDPTTVMCRVL